MSLTVYVNGIGVLGPGLANWQATAEVLANRSTYVSSPTMLPAPTMLPPAERRRIGRVVKVALAVALEATAAAGAEKRSLPSVFSSSGSDGQICNEICGALATPERLVSPTRFSNSVHNAPAGYWSIATGNMSQTNVLCGHDASFVAGLLDAGAQACAERTEVLLVTFDTEYPEPLNSQRPIPDAMGVAMVLAPVVSALSCARLSIEFSAEAPDQLRGELEVLRASVPAARALPLLQAIAGGQATSVVLEYLPDLRARVRIDPCH
jgi:hypothetical protein